jgi:hypothetical protein
MVGLMPLIPAGKRISVMPLPPRVGPVAAIRALTSFTMGLVIPARKRRISTTSPMSMMPFPFTSPQRYSRLGSALAVMGITVTIDSDITIASKVESSLFFMSFLLFLLNFYTIGIEKFSLLKFTKPIWY